jgi:phosphoribosylamine-glycine ligase
MLTKEGPKAIGYKLGFGSAAAQALLPLLTQDTDRTEVMLACIQGLLKSIDINSEGKTSIMVYVFGEVMPELAGSLPLQRPVARFPPNSRSCR